MYSLGNFISNQYGGSNGDWNKLIGFMATLDITKTVSKDNEVNMTFDKWQLPVHSRSEVSHPMYWNPSSLWP